MIRRCVFTFQTLGYFRMFIGEPPLFIGNNLLVDQCSFENTFLPGAFVNVKEGSVNIIKDCSFRNVTLTNRLYAPVFNNLVGTLELSLRLIYHLLVL